METAAADPAGNPLMSIVSLPSRGSSRSSAGVLQAARPRSTTIATSASPAAEKPQLADRVLREHSDCDGDVMAACSEAGVSAAFQAARTRRNRSSVSAHAAYDWT